MSVVALAREPQSLPDRLLELLDRVDYRLAVTDQDRDEVFRLRYDAYSREGGVAPRFDRRLSDRYDDLDNTSVFGMYIDGQLAGTIRASVVSAALPECPAMEVFPDLIHPLLDAGKVIIDPTRFASDDDLAHAYPTLLPYLTIRLPWMAAEYFKADYILATVKAEHRAFYRRTFNCIPVGEPRFYPTLLKPHYLMTCDYRTMRAKVQARYPSFGSSAFERRMLFEGHQHLGGTLSPRLDSPHLAPVDAAVGIPAAG